MLHGQALYTVPFYEGPVLFLKPTNKKRDTEQGRHPTGWDPRRGGGGGGEVKVLYKVSLEEATHRGLTPQPFVHHFDRKATPFINIKLKKGIPFTYFAFITSPYYE